MSHASSNPLDKYQKEELIKEVEKECKAQRDRNTRKVDSISNRIENFFCHFETGSCYAIHAGLEFTL